MINKTIYANKKHRVKHKFITTTECLLAATVGPFRSLFVVRYVIVCETERQESEGVFTDSVMRSSHLLSRESCLVILVLGSLLCRSMRDNWLECISFGRHGFQTISKVLNWSLRKFLHFVIVDR